MFLQTSFIIDEQFRLLNQKLGNVPLYQTRAITPIGFAIVDELFLPQILNLGPWFLGDKREPAAPRINLRVPGVGKKMFPLNRLIASIRNEMVATSSSEPPVLDRFAWYDRSTKLPPIRFLTKNPFDCRLSNLLIGSFNTVGDAPASVLSVPSIDKTSDLSKLPVYPKANEINEIDLDELFRTGSLTTEPVPQTSMLNELDEALASKPSIETIEPKGSKEIASLRSLLRSESNDNSPLVKPEA